MKGLSSAPIVQVPIGGLPRVGMAWISVHGDGHRGDPLRQAFTVEGFWGVHLYRYHATVRGPWGTLPITPGTGGFTPPGARMEYRFRGRSEHIFFHLAWDSPVESTAVPALFSVGPGFAGLWSRMEESLLWRTQNPLAASVRAWDVLLQMVRLATAGVAAFPTKGLSARIQLFIDERLREGVTPRMLAEELGITVGHASQICRAETGVSLGELIQQRQKDVALHLLTATTLPIKSVAREVGITDAQYFNKRCRSWFGASPLSVRERGSG